MEIVTTQTVLDSCLEPYFTDQEAKDQVKRCAEGYARPTSFGAALLYAGYIVWNAVKHIFNVSDWQVARRSLENNFIFPFESLLEHPFVNRDDIDFDQMLETLTELKNRANADSFDYDEARKIFFDSIKESLKGDPSLKEKFQKGIENGIQKLETKKKTFREMCQECLQRRTPTTNNHEDLFDQINAGFQLKGDSFRKFLEEAPQFLKLAYKIYAMTSTIVETVKLAKEVGVIIEAVILLGCVLF